MVFSFCLKTLILSYRYDFGELVIWMIRFDVKSLFDVIALQCNVIPCNISVNKLSTYMIIISFDVKSRHVQDMFTIVQILKLLSSSLQDKATHLWWSNDGTTWEKQTSLVLMKFSIQSVVLGTFVRRALWTSRSAAGTASSNGVGKSAQVRLLLQPPRSHT